MPEIAITPVSTREEAISAVQTDAHILVVDTFPRGLGGELAQVLPTLRCPKVLIHRVLNPDYVARFRLRDFVSDYYQTIICPGERGVLADLPQARFTLPWVVREPRKADTNVDVVVCAGGNATELHWYGEVAGLLNGLCDVKCIAAECPEECPIDVWVQHWPSIDWIARAKVVVGGAGYNTVNECQALGVPLIARPWDRQYDLQRWRAEQRPDIRIVLTPQEAAEAALEALRQPRATAPPFRNGANDAAASLK